MNIIVVTLINALCAYPQGCSDYYMKCMEDSWHTSVLLSKEHREALCTTNLLDKLDIKYKLEVYK